MDDLESSVSGFLKCVKSHERGEVFLAAMAATPSLIACVIEGQRHDPAVKKIVEDLVVDELDECPT